MTEARTAPVSVVVVAAIDSVARDCVLMGMLLDLPDTVAVRHDLASTGSSGMRRTITDAGGVIDNDLVPLEGGCCPSCAVREDLLATVTRLAGTGRWQTVVAALPSATAPEAAAFQLDQAIADGLLPGAVLTSVVAVVDLDSLEHDLLGDDLLADRDLALGDMDRRSVGEAVASQVEFADVVIAVAPGPSTAGMLLRHLVSASSQLHTSWDEVHVPDLVQRVHDSSVARRRVDPWHGRANGAADHDQVWTVELATPRPLHPGRLLRHIEELGGGRVRARGYFWIPSRPGTACVWDGSGGQLSIGQIGPWKHRRPATRLVVTGVDLHDRHRIQDAFARVVATADEAAAPHRWVGVEDGLEPWLGHHQASGRRA